MDRWLTRYTAMTLVLVAVVGALYWFVTTDPLETIDGPVELAGVHNLERIELMPPDSRETPDLIVLQRRGSEWWITRPEEAVVDPDVAQRLQTTFATSIATDDLRFSTDHAASVGLDDDTAVRVALFGTGDERPTAELLIGTEIEVPETGARRTFVQPADDDVIYRAHHGFGHLVRAPVDELRYDAGAR